MRGLARVAVGLFWTWGGVALLKGLWDCFVGQPEANFFSPEPWQFVTREQWFRFAGFEIAYGAACLGLGQAVRVCARRLPEWAERPAPVTEPGEARKWLKGASPETMTRLRQEASPPAALRGPAARQRREDSAGKWLKGASPETMDDPDRL